MSFDAQDEAFMRRALVLARRGLGWTSPNPAVGAVLVRGGRVLGEGWHRQAGGPHAEIEAIRAAERQPRSMRPGATLYVSLEPCCTQGRTPPCTAAILAAGIQRVVVAAIDPNPGHAGRGLELLSRAGVTVEAGLLAAAASELNAGFNNWITTGLPLVIAKAALSLDGRMHTRTGDSKWITSETARRTVHRLRARVDAIMVGAGTVKADDPQLTLRHGVRGQQPWRVVVGRCPPTAKLLNDQWRDRTLVFPTRDLRRVLRQLGQRGITSVLVEGGPRLLAALFEKSLVDRVAYFLAPRIIALRPKVAQATALRGRWRRLGGDEILFEGEVRR